MGLAIGRCEGGGMNGFMLRRLVGLFRRDWLHARPVKPQPP